MALQAAAEHGFALGGGNALIAHGLISRPTQDVDLFTNEERGVEAAADSVEAALRAAGFQAERLDKAAGLADIFYDMGQGLAEWAITGPGGEQMALQMAYFERSRGPVIMEFGPVLDLEDAIGGKVCALVPLTELTMRGCGIPGWRRFSLARFRGHGLGRRREGSGRAGRPAHRGVAGYGRPVGALPAV